MPPGRSRSSTRSARSAPRPHILIRTSAPRWLFDRTVRVPVDARRRRRATPASSRSTACSSTRTRPSGARRRSTRRCATGRCAKRRFSAQHDVRLVIADAPPLGCAAAAAAGIPSVVVSNFTWDWIYQAYRRGTRTGAVASRCAARGLRTGDGRMAPADARRLRDHRSRHRRALRGAPRAASRGPTCARCAGCPPTGRWRWCRSAATG